MINTLIDLFGVKVAHAADVSVVANFVGKLNRLIFNPLIILLFGAALVYFLYGMLQFLMGGGKAEARELGKSHMMWGIVGMVIMFGAFAILKIITTTVGADPNPNLEQGFIMQFFV